MFSWCGILMNTHLSFCNRHPLYCGNRMSWDEFTGKRLYAHATSYGFADNPIRTEFFPFLKKFGEEFGGHSERVKQFDMLMPESQEVDKKNRILQRVSRKYKKRIIRIIQAIEFHSWLAQRSAFERMKKALLISWALSDKTVRLGRF